MNANHLSGTARDAHDESYVFGIQLINAANGISLIERGRMLRANIVNHFPAMEKVFDMLPELN